MSRNLVNSLHIHLLLMFLYKFLCLAFCSEVENPLCQLTGKYQLRLDSQPGVPPRSNNVCIYSVDSRIINN